jgi:exodeoxyribonuclease VII large subunit
MFGPADSGIRIIDVDEISHYIKDLFDSDPLLANVWISGEASNVRRSANGHWYFTLKSATSQLRCALFKNAAAVVDHKPADGDSILVNGRISSYPAFGQYQLYVEQILAAGEGVLQLQLMALREKLETEGLFDPSRKRTIPAYPRHIAVITSPTGAVWQDIQDVLRRRYPLGALLLSPATVQGESAPASVISALEAVIADGRADVVIIARGGGSIEDLWAFNDERVVRAIFRCPIPVVSAIGHETDVTLTDLVADLRAPTPSAAAELVAPHIREYVQHLRARASSLAASMGVMLSRQRSELLTLRHRLDSFDPEWTLQQERMRLDRLGDDLSGHLERTIERRRLSLEGFRRQLELLDPTHLLARGYAIVRSEATGERVVGISGLTSGDAIRLQFHDGSANATIDRIEQRQPETTKERDSD